MKLISRTAAAKLLDCTPQTISNYAKQGLIDEVCRENSGRATIFYDEDQLRALIPDLHELEELKAKVEAEKELLRQDLANLTRDREEARKEHLKINGGKKTLAHVRELIKGAYTYVQESNTVAKTKLEEEVLNGLLNGKKLEEIKAETKATEYRIDKAVKDIAKRLVRLPSLIWENKYLADELDKLTKENKLLKGTRDYRVQPQKITIKRVVNAVDGKTQKIMYELPSKQQLMTTPIEDLNISSFAKEGLLYNNIHTLYELLRYKERELSDMKKIGIDRASEINRYLLDLGLTLGMAKE